MKPIKIITSNSVEIATYDTSFQAAVHGVVERCREECLEDAFYVCDVGDILRKFQRWQTQLPRVAPHYAVKCNDDAVVLETMASIGMGFDCASKSEIQAVLDMGVAPSRIVYANPCKQTTHIKFAAKHRVSMMTFDNADELEKIKYTYPDAQLILRILPMEFKATCQLGIKFGCPQRDVPRLLAKARELQLNIVGVSFHVGSGCQEAAAFPAAVGLARQTFDQALAHGFNPYLLDIGGGFPGDDSFPITFEEICAELRPALDENFPAGSGVEIIAEPGRYFVASAYTLAVNVIAKRQTSADEPDTSADDSDDEAASVEQEPAFMYYVNDGVYGSFNCLLYDHAVVTPTVPGDDGFDARYSSSLWGPTCDGLDCITNHHLLPELDVGDWIVFNNMGAYTLSASSSFNGMPKPRGHYVIGVDDLLTLDADRRAFRQKLCGGRPLVKEAPRCTDYFIPC